MRTDAAGAESQILEVKKLVFVFDPANKTVWTMQDGRMYTAAVRPIASLHTSADGPILICHMHAHMHARTHAHTCP